MKLNFLVRAENDGGFPSQYSLGLMIFDDDLIASQGTSSSPLIPSKDFATLETAQNYIFETLTERFGQNFDLLLSTTGYFPSDLFTEAPETYKNLIDKFLELKSIETPQIPEKKTLSRYNYNLTLSQGVEAVGGYQYAVYSETGAYVDYTPIPASSPFETRSYGNRTKGVIASISIPAIVLPEECWDGKQVVIGKNTGLALAVNFSISVSTSRPESYSAYVYLFQTISNNLLTKYENYTPPLILSDDPYSPGGYNQPGSGSGLNPGATGGIGGGGTFDGQSTAIPLPGLPSLSGIGSGFCGLFNPTASQLNALARFMWSDDFVTNIVKLFGDPMDVILGLNIVPVKPATSGSAEVTAGFISTGVSMPVVSSQYAQVDCGTIDVKEFWGSCLDYSPYTQVQIYLPYIGTHQLDVDEIMGKTIHLIYNIDILSGSCVACLQCGESTLYTFNGSCASSIPVTGQNFNAIISTAVQLAAGVGSFVASGGSMIGAAIGAGDGALTAAGSGGMKPTVQHSGSVQATNGLLGIQTPYIIFTLPTQSVPENQNEYQGYPSNMTLLLSNCTGYTKCAEVHLVNIPATKPELDEIESLLKRGVMI